MLHVQLPWNMTNNGLKPPCALGFASFAYCAVRPSPTSQSNCEKCAQVSHHPPQPKYRRGGAPTPGRTWLAPDRGYLREGSQRVKGLFASPTALPPCVRISSTAVMSFRGVQVALMFLTRGYVQHHDTWELWFKDVQGSLPLSAMQVLPHLFSQLSH